MKEALIFDLSRKGRRGIRFGSPDVPSKPVQQMIPQKHLRSEPADLPELPESEVVRHFIRLSNLNYHVDKNMYPLGSCTMKYNPKINDYTSGLQPRAASGLCTNSVRCCVKLQAWLR